MEEETKLACGLCGSNFWCAHEWVDEAYGQKLSIPHCKHCFYDEGKCPDKHGYQCPNCEKKFPEFNP